ncbi:MAG: hypothetical protein F6K25_08585 [Okeania sp. SIO2G4]|uniref:alpha/beta fold hydrolase n=1 Tax=unclassified Okeania TaxID=2634635 RepID=UPI0013BE31E9|nr:MULTISPECIES: hypothetical protein [unclassified Okeania]NEP06465.1 hypothetical protein [Okeania sp. SIO4D6]NEP39134.1 hypothetical protein [Okeania sp. SIO2H7]NEP72153.1 hypothetical protein [Okeania sp. SIO2G5]NEP91826.1 hypothetical protein [Okeania sp. SIO2F5]NEQ90766.1 hypothetical protein [Okeania sp. SIO2G4]
MGRFCPPLTPPRRGMWGDGEIEKYLVMVEDETFFYTELNGFDIMGKLYDVLETWRERVIEGLLQGQGLKCGHFMAEEVPDEVTQALLDFFRG